MFAKLSPQVLGFRMGQLVTWKMTLTHARERRQVIHISQERNV